MSQGPSWEALLEQVIGAAEREGQPGLLHLAAGSLPEREERALAALPRIIAQLREQGTSEEDLFAAVVAALSRELSGEG